MPFATVAGITLRGYCSTKTQMEGSPTDKYNGAYFLLQVSVAVSSGPTAIGDGTRGDGEQQQAAVHGKKTELFTYHCTNLAWKINTAEQTLRQRSHASRNGYVKSRWYGNRC